MPIEDILALCIGLPALFSLIVLLYIICIKSANTEKRFKESTNKLNEIKIKYYKWLVDENNYYNEDDEERE